MPLSRWRCVTAPLFGLLLALGGGAATAAAPGNSPAPTTGRVRIAVLGDSDSHAYQDRIYFPLGTSARGGAYRATSLQWTELLARLRPDQLDFGPWAAVGVKGRVARVASWFGMTLRMPPKEDHRYNFAISGARCDDIDGGRWRETEHLLNLMREEGQAWQRAVVVIRIGINDIGHRDALDRLAADANDAEIRRQIDACTRAIAEAVGKLKAREPSLRFVLVGIFNNAHWPRYQVHWQDAEQLRNIDAGLDVYDRALRAMASDDPNVAFFEERRIFEADWGGRDAQGRPAYKTRRVGSSLVMSNTSGDEPNHLVLGDGHMGTVWNGLWSNHLLELLKSRFGIAVPALSDQELAATVGR